MVRYFSRSCSGFTLVEMVMTIVLIGIIAAVLAPVLSTTTEGFHNARVRNDLTSQTRIVLERLSREIREASPDPVDVTIGPGNTSIQFRQLSGLVGLVDMGSSMAKTYNGCKYVAVSTAGNTLTWDDDVNDPNNPIAILATNLTGISFSYSAGTMINSGVVTIDLTLSNNGESISTFREVHIRNSQDTVTCI